MSQSIQYVISNGTRIGYSKWGTGPGLIICPDLIKQDHHYDKLISILSNTYTVYILNRRAFLGRSTVDSKHNLRTYLEDLVALIDVTNVECIFGHGFGGLIALELMLIHPVKKLALYEPLVSVNKSLPADWLTHFEEALEKDQLRKAMAISIKGLKIPQLTSALPLWVLRMFADLLGVNDKKQNQRAKKDLLYTLSDEIKMVMHLNSKSERYEGILQPVLLMAGTRSSAYFLQGLRAVEKFLPLPRTEIFRDYNHNAPFNRELQLADLLKEFLNKRGG